VIAHLIVRSGKSEAEVIINIKDCAAAEANYWQTRSVAQPLCDTWTSCLS